jgi:acetyl esterase/lipase
MQKITAAPLSPTWSVLPKTADEWSDVVRSAAAATIRNLPPLREWLKVNVEPVTINGVKAYSVTPEAIPPENRNRLLIHFRGGYYVLSPGEAGTTEAIFMAGLGGFKVISVDYRMPPEHPYPAAIEDGIQVWKAALQMADPKNMAFFGTSAGGGFTLAMVLRAKKEGLSLPAATAPGTPMSDLSKTGDCFHANAMVDNVLVSPDGRCDAAAKLYANGHDLKDPLLSPVYGDMSGFPPTILTTGNARPPPEQHRPRASQAASVRA